VLINGRLSARSFTRYRLVRGLIGAVLAHADKILVQTAADARRFGALGALPERIIVTGNTKFDLDDSPLPLRPALADFARGRRILVAGSTAAGEERMVIEIYRNLRERFRDLALALAPRHLERVPEVEEDLREEGLRYTKASNVSASPDPGSSVILVDTMGELRGFYHRAEIAFVGGSMNPPRGGQSLAEPAAAGIPILFGPHFESQRQIGDALLAAGAAIVINDGAELETQCAAWLVDETVRRAAGEAARHVLEQLADGAANTVRHLRPMLAVS
jgi:3-deoxy-D-manno-octulosonic-acid transferase